MRTAGLELVPLSASLLDQLGTEEAVNCLDILTGAEGNPFWLKLWTSSLELGLTRHQRLMVLQNSPGLTYSHPEHFRSQEDLLWMARNFRGVSQCLVKTTNGSSEEVEENGAALEAFLLEKNIVASSPSSLLHLSLGLPCFAFRARMWRLQPETLTEGRRLGANGANSKENSTASLTKLLTTMVLDGSWAGDDHGLDVLLENLSFAAAAAARAGGADPNWWGRVTRILCAEGNLGLLAMLADKLKRREEKHPACP